MILDTKLHVCCFYIAGNRPVRDSSRTISALARTALELKNISMNLGLENSTFQHLGK